MLFVISTCRRCRRAAATSRARGVIYHREERARARAAETRNLSSVSNYRSRTVIGSLYTQSQIGSDILYASCASVIYRRVLRAHCVHGRVRE